MAKPGITTHKQDGPVRGCWCFYCEELRVLADDRDPKPGEMVLHPIPHKPCEDEVDRETINHTMVEHGQVMDGAEDSRTDPRFDDMIGFIPFAYHLLPTDGLAKVAAIMRKGEISGRPSDGWRVVPVEEQINHAISHLTAYLAGRGSDHLAHAGCRVLMALDLERDPVMGAGERDTLYRKALGQLLRAAGREEGPDWAEQVGGPMVDLTTE